MAIFSHKRKWNRFFPAGWLVLILPSLLLAVNSSAVPIQVVSTRNPAVASPAGGNGDSVAPWISPDGRFLLFSSSANNLVPGDNSQLRLDVYLRDCASNTTVLVSANSYGTGGGNNHSIAGQVSTNGRYAVFESDASDLLPGDTNGVTDIFVRDLLVGTNILVSVAPDGSWGNGASTSPVMTPDGRYVAFVSAATNLAAGVTNGILNVFLRDLVNGTTTWVTTNSTGSNVVAALPVITPDGRYVAFFSTATGMAAGVSASAGGEIYLYDSVSNTMTWASTNAASMVSTRLQLNNAPSTHPALSSDGRYVAFKTGWTNGTTSPGGSGVAAVIFFQYDAVNGTSVIVNSNGYAPWLNCDDVYGPEMTPDGRFVAFMQRELNGTNCSVRLWDRLAGTNVLVSANPNGVWPTNSDSHTPSMSTDGRYVTFLSNATNLVVNAVSNGMHLYRRDLQTATTVLVDADTNGIGTGDQVGTIPALSANGSRVAFAALDGRLASLDNNNAQDIFLWDASVGTNTMISVNNPLAASQSATGPSSLGQYSVSGNGTLVAFISFARDLVTNNLAVDLTATNIAGELNVFVHDLLANTNILVSVDRNGVGTNVSYSPVISADGRYVVFASDSPVLVTGDNDSAVDIFRRDLQAGTTARVSLILSAGAGTVGSAYDASFPAISQDGRYVTFICRTNTSTAMSALFWCDMNSNLTLTVSGSVSNQPVTMSANGRRVAYFATGGRLCVWDAILATNIYTNSTAGLTSAVLSPAGNRLLYQAAGGLYVYDLVGKTNLFICAGTAPIKSPSPWSGDGRYVAFVTATNLVAGDNNGTNDIYFLDYQTGNIVLVSMDQTGLASAAGISDSPMVSEDGRFVAFRCFATNVLPGVVNPPSLILYDRLGGTNTLLATGTADTGWTTWVSQPVFSTDGSHLVFQSWDAGLVSGDLNGAGDVFAGNLSGWPALDSDGDGIPDWWMIEYFGHATGQAGDLSLAQDDADGDGMNNLQEFLAGTVPTDPTSVLALRGALDATGTNIMLNWTAVSGRSYQIISATNLSNAPWTVLPASVQAGSAAGVGGSRTFFVPATNSPGFFRLQTGN